MHLCSRICKAKYAFISVGEFRNLFKQSTVKRQERSEAHHRIGKIWGSSSILYQVASNFLSKN
jgi:hypothetical protein